MSGKTFHDTFISVKSGAQALGKAIDGSVLRVPLIIAALLAGLALAGWATGLYGVPQSNIKGVLASGATYDLITVKGDGWEHPLVVLGDGLFVDAETGDELKWSGDGYVYTGRGCLDLFAGGECADYPASVKPADYHEAPVCQAGQRLYFTPSTKTYSCGA